MYSKPGAQPHFTVESLLRLEVGSIMDTNIDLLPPQAKKAKARRSLVKRLVAIQVAIFALLIAAVFMFGALENHAHLRHSLLYSKISAIGSSPTETALKLQQIRTQVAYINEFFADQLPTYSISTALQLIHTTTPENVTLARITYHRGEILLESHAHNLATAEAHILLILQHFEYAQMGRITLTEHRYTYEIHITLPTE